MERRLAGLEELALEPVAGRWAEAVVPVAGMQVAAQAAGILAVSKQVAALEPMVEAELVP